MDVSLRRMPGLVVGGPGLVFVRDLGTLALDEAPHAYDIFQKKRDGAVKVLLRP